MKQRRQYLLPSMTFARTILYRSIIVSVARWATTSWRTTRITSTTTILSWVTTGCRASAITPVRPVISSIRITVAVPISPAVVTVAVIAITITITIIPVSVRITVTVTITMAWFPVAHVFSWSRCMGPVSYWIVNTNTTAIELLTTGQRTELYKRKETYNAIEFLDTTSCLLNSWHFDETKTPGTVGLDSIKTQIAQPHKKFHPPAGHRQWWPWRHDQNDWILHLSRVLSCECSNRKLQAP